AFPTLLVTRLLKLPTVLHWRVAAPLNMPVKRLANAVIVISEAARNYAVRAGMAQEKVFLIRSAIHVEDFRRPGEEVPRDLRRQLGIPEEAFVIAETARMAPGKGHDVILKAIVELPPSERPIVLMAGNGHEGEKLQRLAENLGLNQFVRFTGFVDDVRTVLWASNVFVHVPNFFPEGVSVAILEAMAAGLPVIASKVGGIPEVVRNGETGLIVPPNDPKALAEAINELRKDKALCEKIGKQAQEWVREHHDARQLPDRVIQVYNQVTAKKIVGS
ncbi:MAG: glycosyltransferase family 4 protein, partial [Armatimonadota bacterium]|nr:glycosyltransferase family 4 protein [Armatimonadota bacterium]MDW8144318.1 glycosyltransferase family 4 protein [Armatimonadota bacterium]